MKPWLFLALAVALLFAGCRSGQHIQGAANDVRRFHDDSLGVTCWTFVSAVQYAGGISCLPDSAIGRRAR